MIDDSDVHDFEIMALFTDGPAGWILLAIAVVLLIIVAGNEEDCAKKTCPSQMTPKLMEHSCMCVTEAK